MTTIALQNLGKSFGQTTAVADVSLSLRSGSFTALLGPSGCGKTTLLRLIAGFEQPSSGAVLFEGETMADRSHMVPPERRHLGIVFQSYALWPHMDVAANVAYPLKGRGLSRAQVDAKVAEALETVSLSGYGNRQVDALSGGQRQRVALARCLVTGTNIILLDEPLANLDVHLRANMLDVFADIHARTGATIVFVTHDQSEALALADTIVVMDRGYVQQVGTPQHIYAEPANAMVAGFVGRGAIVEATALPGIHKRGGDGSSLLIRPQAVSLNDSGIATTVGRARYTGAAYETILTLPNGDTLIADFAERLPTGQKVKIAIGDAWAIPT